MTAYAIVQHPDFEADLPPAGHEQVFASTFWRKSQFGEALREGISELHRLDDASPKALIISTHGATRTGTSLDVVTEHVDLSEYRGCFGVLPNNLTVYLNACWGAYPSTAAAIQSGIRRPPVVGPLVEIYPSLANRFQAELLDLLDAGAPSTRALYRLVRRFNNEETLRVKDYGGQQSLFGMWDVSGTFFPRAPVGVQLSAGIEQGEFRLCDLAKSDGNFGDVVACMVEHVYSGQKLQANLGAILELIDGDLAEYIGMRFNASFQVVSDLTDPKDVGFTGLPVIRILALR